MPMQKSLNDYPKRGEFYIVDLDPGFGREIHKKRPVLVISDNIVNSTRYHIVIIPASTIIPRILTSDMVFLGKPKGFDEKSVLLPLFIRGIDKDRLIKKIGKISKIKLSKIEESLKLILGMSDL